MVNYGGGGAKWRESICGVGADGEATNAFLAVISCSILFLACQVKHRIICL